MTGSDRTGSIKKKANSDYLCAFNINLVWVPAVGGCRDDRPGGRGGVYSESESWGGGGDDGIVGEDCSVLGLPAGVAALRALWPGRVLVVVLFLLFDGEDDPLGVAGAIGVRGAAGSRDVALQL